MQYFTIIVAALIGLFSIVYTNTDKVGKRAKVILIFLLIFCSGYSIYETHRDEAFLEPWQATRLVYDKVLQQKLRFDTVIASNDTIAMKKFVDDATELSFLAEKYKAPEYVRSKISLLTMTEQLLVLSATHPRYTIAQVLNEAMQSQSPGMTSGQALLKLNYFRVEDFGPPYYVLGGFDSRGNPIVIENRLTRDFFVNRAQDIFRDLVLESQ